MPTVTMPQLGESVTEGTIGKWLKQVGDHVDKYEPIVEVITDKVNAEVPSPFEGILTSILVQEGETVPNNAEIAVVEAGGATQAAASTPTAAPTAAPSAVPTSAPTSAPAPAPTPPARASGDPATSTMEVRAPSTNGSNVDGATVISAYEGRMTPAVRRIAREHAIDLSKIQGTGHAGRVTRDDVMRLVPAAGQPAQAASAVPSTSAAAAPSPAVAVPSTPPASPVAHGDSLKLSTPMRRAIAAQMTKSLSAPVAYITIEVDMSAVVRRRDSARREYQSREGIGLSYVAFVAKAVVEALRIHPDLNGHWTDEGLWRRKQVNVGIAVAVDDGLVVPVIRNADGLSMHGLNRAINDLAERARTSKLRMDDITGGTFTLDNTGWTGSILTLPIINVPEVAILTMEAIVKRPVVVESAAGDSIAIRPMMNMCLGIDHRANDGAQAGRFLADIKRWLESVDDQTSIG